MTITLELTARAEAELARQAEINGQGMEAHAASLLEEALHLSPSQDPGADGEPHFGKSLVDVFDEARRLGLFADGALDFSRDPSPGRTVDLS